MDAIIGCSLTPFNMGDNPRGQRYDGLNIIFKDADNIDRFIKNKFCPPKPKTKAEKFTENNIAAITAWAQEEMLAGEADE